MVIAQQVHNGHREQQKQNAQQQRKAGAQQGRHTQRAADIGQILFTPVLTDDNPQTALCAKDNADEQKNRHIGCGYGRHLGIAQPTDHKCINQAEGKGD